MWEFITALFLAVGVTHASYSSRDVRCSVCKVVIQELEKDIAKVDPNKKINLSHRINEEGKIVHKTKQFARSEIHLSELMEVICDKMENYVRATNKNSKMIEIIPLLTDSGAMNPKFGDYEVVQDSDLNQSLKFHCQGIIEEYDTEIINVLQDKRKDSDIKICFEVTKLCKNASEKRNIEL